MSARDKKYTGKLTERLKTPSPSGLGHADGRTRARHREEHEKLLLLLKHFGIEKPPPDCWYDLALALARAHVPGFQPPPQNAGRPRIWEPFDEIFAYGLIKAVLAEHPKQSVQWACAYVARSWLGHGEKGNKQVSTYAFVKDVAEHPKQSDYSVCTYIVKRDPWLSWQGERKKRNKPDEILRQMYYKVRREIRAGRLPENPYTALFG